MRSYEFAGIENRLVFPARRARRELRAEACVPGAAAKRPPLGPSSTQPGTFHSECDTCAPCHSPVATLGTLSTEPCQSFPPPGLTPGALLRANLGRRGGV